MKGVAKFILFSLTLFTLFSFLSIQKDNNIIEWSEARPLTWDDFKGKSEKRFAVASTHYDILKDVTATEKGCTVNVRAVFFTNKSWKKTAWTANDILLHEQKHFDIVEIYARKIRKALKEKNIKTLSEAKSTLKNVYDKYDKEMDQYQNRYDDESDGSMDGEGQRKWNKKITEELEALKDYKSSTIIIDF